MLRNSGKDQQKERTSMPQQKIKREELKTTFNGKTVPVMRIWYGETDITVAFAASKHLPVFPLKQEDLTTIWAVVAIEGKTTLRIWIDEFVTGCEIHHIDMSYPRVENRPNPTFSTPASMSESTEAGQESSLPDTFW